MPKTAERLIIVHYGELWLRGKNRGHFISMLLKNLAELLSGEAVSISTMHDRIILTPKKGFNEERVMQKLTHLFGISKFEFSYITKPELKAIKSLSLRLISKFPKGTTIKIQSHRAYKKLEFDSNDVYMALTSLAKKKGLIIRGSKGFENEVNVNITREKAFINTKSNKGAGGLPVGTGSKAVILLSGGIDSPVAAWYAMKRGILPVYIHFHGYSSNNAKELSKINELAEKLGEYHKHYKLYLFPANLFQLAALKSGSSETVLLKSFMLHVADKIADANNAPVLYTGDCLGQVSSQTSRNLLAEGYGVEHPILRPLIGFDKTEIIEIARKIGTYDISIKPYKDVCSINAKNPSTNVPVESIKQMHKAYKIKGIVARTIKLAKVIEK